MNIFNP